MAGNLGDDLMVDIILKKYPKFRFFCDSTKYDYIFSNNKNFRPTEYYYRKYGHLNRLLSIIRPKNNNLYENIFKTTNHKCICSVYVGGSIFMQGSINNAQDLHKRITHEEKKFSNGPLFIIGANFGPYTFDEFQTSFFDYFEKCGGVTFRDKFSYSLFSQLNNITYAPDVVFSIDTSAYNIEKPFFENEYVVLSVIDLYKKTSYVQLTEHYDNLIADLCKKIVNSGKIPLLMSFCKSEGDEAAIIRIINLLNSDTLKKTQTYFYRGNLDEALSVLKFAQSIIATRFHAMVLAIKFNIPSFSFSYNEKMANVLNDIGFYSYANIQNIANLDATKVLNGISPPPIINDYIDKSVMQFNQLNEYLKLPQY